MRQEPKKRDKCYYCEKCIFSTQPKHRIKREYANHYKDQFAHIGCNKANSIALQIKKYENHTQ